MGVFTSIVPAKGLVRRCVGVLDWVVRYSEKRDYSRNFRLFLSVLFYGGGSVFSLWLANWLKIEIAFAKLAPYFWEIFLNGLIWILPLKLLFFFLFRLFDGLLVYFSVPDLLRMGAAILSSSVAAYGVNLVVDGPGGIVLLLDLLICLILFPAARLILRVCREAVVEYRHQSSAANRKVVIVGAGDEGAILVRELLTRPSLGMRPLFFLDNVKYRWHGHIHGVPVLGGLDLLGDRDTMEGIHEVLFSDSQMEAEHLRKSVHVLNKRKIPFRTITPFLRDLNHPGQAPLLKPLELSDFLRREQAHLDTEGLRQLIAQRTILVTGAGGSIGSELTRQVAARAPKKLILLERSEASLFLIQQEIQQQYPEVSLQVEVADICNEQRIRLLLEQTRPDIVYHAAAHKHVPMMESQPAEALYNNCMGTWMLGQLAATYGVSRFILISTDKAVKPSSVMGATKRLAELSLFRLQEQHPSTAFMVVRFGNVLGSSGSVIPIFEQQIQNGGPVTVTHPEVTRYFMTISEAVGLVLQSSWLGKGGEIYSPDMGKPVKILDLAHQLIEFFGGRPGVDIEVRFSGLRPGEKLHEELTYGDEKMEPSAHDRVFQITGGFRPDSVWWNRLQQLVGQRFELNSTQIVQQMQDLLPEYKPAYNLPNAVSPRD